MFLRSDFYLLGVLKLLILILFFSKRILFVLVWLWVMYFLLSQIHRLRCQGIKKKFFHLRVMSKSIHPFVCPFYNRKSYSSLSKRVSIVFFLCLFMTYWSSFSSACDRWFSGKYSQSGSFHNFHKISPIVRRSYIWMVDRRGSNFQGYL